MKAKEDGLVPLADLPDGTLVETHAGDYVVIGGVKVGSHCVLVAPHSLAGSLTYLQPGALVREIDLPFLLMAAADRLEENDAYRRGVVEGCKDLVSAGDLVPHNTRVYVVAWCRGHATLRPGDRVRMKKSDSYHFRDAAGSGPRHADHRFRRLGDDKTHDLTVDGEQYVLVIPEE